MVSTSAMHSATVAESQIPLAPMSFGRKSTEIDSAMKVLTNEIRAEIPPFESAVKNDELNTLNPHIRNMNEYNLKALTVRSRSSLS